jgi:beta-galactosidase/beta-glucuronidase
MPHAIRLRGPWDYQPLACTVLRPDGSTQAVSGSLPPAGRVEMPADWGRTLGTDFRGRVRYVRRFGCPSGLEPADRVELLIDRLDAFGTVWLNGQLLLDVPPGETPSRVDVTARLRPRNELVIEVECPRETSGMPSLQRGDRGRPAGRPDRRSPAADPASRKGVRTGVISLCPSRRIHLIPFLFRIWGWGRLADVETGSSIRALSHG